MRNINEAQINNADVKALFRDAVSVRNTPTGLGKISSRFRKEKIDIADLQQAWKDDGFSDDVADIERILKDHGFSTKEVKKVFANVLGSSNGGDDADTPVASATIQKIANYAKTAGIDKEIIEFMRREYNFNESTFYSGKAVIEDVRKIFSEIVHEERSNRADLIKKYNMDNLGRNKK